MSFYLLFNKSFIERCLPAWQLTRDRDKPNMNKPISLSLTRTSISPFQGVLSDLSGPREGRAGAIVAPSHLILQTEVKRQVQDAISDDRNSSSPCQNSQKNFHIISSATALKFPPQTLSEIPHCHFDGAANTVFFLWVIYQVMR